MKFVSKNRSATVKIVKKESKVKHNKVLEADARILNVETGEANAATLARGKIIKTKTPISFCL